MSQSRALSMLKQARTLVERKTAIQFAVDHGVPLSEIEMHLDQIDAARQHESANNAANPPAPPIHLSQGDQPTSHGED